MMAEQKSIRAEKHRSFGEGLVLFIWNLLIGVLLIVFVVLYVPFYFLRRVIQRIPGRKEAQGQKE